jgi:hypothetical protein
MAVYRYVNLDIREAQLLADLTGIEHDLKATVTLCDRLEAALKDTFEGRQHDLITLETLTTAVLVRYARSFTSGVRARLPKQILQGLPPKLLDDHRWFKALRDKYIAHSVNAFEENMVVAYLAPEELGTREVQSISVQQSRLASLGLDDVDCLRVLCQELCTRVSELIEQERARVLEVARKLPVDQLYTQEGRAPTVVTRKTVEQSRKRL